jgi:alcohol dehydrogenase (cytochrome c)
LDKIRPVTDEMLTHVPDGEWLLWRRTYDALGFSPLKKINRTNISDLRVAWTWSLRNGPNESTPVVHDGVLFIESFGDKVQALDAATGDLLWQYSRRLPSGVAPSIKRGISIYGTKLYVPTSDSHLVALDVKTGKVMWDQQIADVKKGYRLVGGPLVARGQVMIGTTGRAEGGNFVAALDAETGKETWRFYTIARPREFGGNSWNGLPLEKRKGASVWIPGSYDPVPNRQHVRYGPAPHACGHTGAHERRLVSGHDDRVGSADRKACVALPASGERAVGSRLGIRTDDGADVDQR